MKKIISSIIVLTLLASTILITPIVASANIIIPNDNKWHQFDVTADSTYTYDIVVPATGRIYVDLFFATYDSYIDCSLYDDDYKNELVSRGVGVDESIPSTEGFDKVLSKGTYHLIFKTDERGGYIKVKPKFINYGCNIKDNSTYDSPNILSNNKIYTGAFTETNDSYSWFKFTIPSRKIVKVSFWSYVDHIHYSLYNKDLQKTYIDRADLYGTESSPNGHTETFTLNKGTYYVKIEQDWDPGRYKVRVTSFTTPKLNCKSATIKRNKTKQLKVSGGLGTIKWSSSNRRIAVVNSKGKVTGKKKGTCYIYARRNGYGMSCKVRIK
ncbi:MAG: Ig-like domain-containing protein [Ruminococcus sp.]|nr:Ig-like domain-containing protein [Ruminococcus sp.]MDD5889639.1 Ig-like domain-containing protein [Ruminococcus sp.]